MALSQHINTNDIFYQIEFLTLVKRSIVNIKNQDKVGSGIFSKIDSNPPIFCLITDCTVISYTTPQISIYLKYSTQKAKFQRPITDKDCGNFQQYIAKILLKSSNKNLSIIQLSNKVSKELIQNDASFLSISEPRLCSDVVYFEILELENDFKTYMSPVVQVKESNFYEFEVNAPIKIFNQGGVFIDLECKTLIGLSHLNEKSLKEKSTLKGSNIFYTIEEIKSLINSFQAKFLQNDIIEENATDINPDSPSLGVVIIIFTW